MNFDLNSLIEKKDGVLFIDSLSEKVEKFTAEFMAQFVEHHRKEPYRTILKRESVECLKTTTLDTGIYRKEC